MTDNVNMNADGSMRIERTFESNGKRFHSEMTLSESIKMTVSVASTTMDLFDDVSDEKIFPMGSFKDAWGWAANRISDFQFGV